MQFLASINKVEPDEIYNLAVLNHVQVSFEVPQYTVETDPVGTLCMAAKELGWRRKVDFVSLVKMMVREDCKKLNVNIDRG